MKKLLLILVAISTLMVFFGCSEKDDNNPTAVHVWAYSLDQFISKTAVHDTINASASDTTDYRGLYNYQIVSNEDGFSPRNSTNAGYDINWDKFKQGYYVPGNGFETWFPNSMLPNAFKVSSTGLFRLYRKIDVNAGSRGTTSVELHALQIYPIVNSQNVTEDAIKLTDLLTGIAAYDSVRMVCYDGYGEDKYYHTDDINAGYYLLTSEKTIFPNHTFPQTGYSSLKKVSYIDVYGATTTPAVNFVLADEDKADIIFHIPPVLSDLDATDINGMTK